MNYTILVIHVLFMLGSLFPAAAGVVFACIQLRTGRFFRATVGMTFVGAMLLFIGGIPLGWAVAYSKSGVAWSGVPFGWDFTDNKTLILVTYWALALAMVWRTVSDIVSARFDRFRQDPLSPRTFAWFVIYGGFLEATIFLIPHSIQLPAIATGFAFVAAAAPVFVLIAQRLALRRVQLKTRA